MTKQEIINNHAKEIEFCNHRINYGKISLAAKYSAEIEIKSISCTIARIARLDDSVTCGDNVCNCSDIKGWSYSTGMEMDFCLNCDLAIVNPPYKKALANKV